MTPSNEKLWKEANDKCKGDYQCAQKYMQIHKDKYKQEGMLTTGMPLDFLEGFEK